MNVCVNKQINQYGNNKIKAYINIEMNKEKRYMDVVLYCIFVQLHLLMSLHVEQ